MWVNTLLCVTFFGLINEGRTETEVLCLVFLFLTNAINNNLGACQSKFIS